MGLDVRQAVREDMPAVLDIYNDAVLNTMATADIEPQTLETRLAWFEERTAAGFPVLVAEFEGVIAGWSSFGRFHNRPGYRFTVENSVYVAAGNRRKGVGTALLRPLIPIAANMNMHSIVALVDASNSASISLHKRCGFSEAGRLQQAVYKFNRWNDVLLLQCML